MQKILNIVCAILISGFFFSGISTVYAARSRMYYVAAAHISEGQYKPAFDEIIPMIGFGSILDALDLLEIIIKKIDDVSSSDGWLTDEQNRVKIYYHYILVVQEYLSKVSDRFGDRQRELVSRITDIYEHRLRLDLLSLHERGELLYRYSLILSHVETPEVVGVLLNSLLIDEEYIVWRTTNNNKNKVLSLAKRLEIKFPEESVSPHKHAKKKKRTVRSTWESFAFDTDSSNSALSSSMAGSLAEIRDGRGCDEFVPREDDTGLIEMGGQGRLCVADTPSISLPVVRVERESTASTLDVSKESATAQVTTPTSLLTKIPPPPVKKKHIWDE